jgi:hypothetical protein
MERYQSSVSSSILWTALILAQATIAFADTEACFANDSMNEFFATDEPTCCQNDVCVIPCPEPVSEPPKGRLDYCEVMVRNVL